MTLTPDFVLKRGDVGKVHGGVVRDASGNPVNCTGFTSAVIKWTNLMTEAVKINWASITIPTPTTGGWTYILTAGDVDTSGWYKQEIRIFFGTTRVTFPTDNDSPFTIVKVQDDLG